MGVEADIVCCEVASPAARLVAVRPARPDALRVFPVDMGHEQKVCRRVGAERFSADISPRGSFERCGLPAQ